MGTKEIRVKNKTKHHSQGKVHLERKSLGDLEMSWKMPLFL